MNKDNAHLYLPFIKALSEGKTIQEQFTGRWIAKKENNFHLPPQYYRIYLGPTTAWYRVAELSGDEDGMPVNIAWNEEGERNAENHKTFVRWLGDRVEYEVTE